jgi:hypothetical protein
MKRILFLTVMLMSILICGTALAAELKVGQNITFVGTIEERIAHGEGSERVRLYLLEDVPENNTRGINTVFGADVYANATDAFMDCFLRAEYGKIYEINAKIRKIEGSSVTLAFDKSSTCKQR